MPGLRRGDEAKLEVMRELRRNRELTLNSLRQAVGSSSFTSVKATCLFLERLGLVRIENRPVGGKAHLWVSLTDLGRAAAKKL